MRTLAALAGLTLSAPTFAAGIDGELSVELGSLQNSDRAYDLFSSGNGMPSRGVRAGLAFTENLSVVAGWHHVSRGATVSVETGGDGFQTALFADELTAGPKAQMGFADVFFPYVTTQALFFRGTMKLDDDDTTRHNPAQLQASALAPGLLAMGGVEFRSPTETSDLAVGFFLEMGYGYVARADYGAFGAMKPGGFAVRSGMGLRF